MEGPLCVTQSICVPFPYISHTWVADNRTMSPLSSVTVYLRASTYRSISVHVYMYTDACEPVVTFQFLFKTKRQQPRIHDTESDDASEADRPTAVTFFCLMSLFIGLNLFCCRPYPDRSATVQCAQHKASKK